MDRTIQAPMGGYAPPKSNRTRTKEAIPPLSRSSAWFNSIAAALLLLTLGGGAYLSQNGGFGFGGGGGGGGEGRFAAQVVSPEASPVGNASTCEVEPLTTDEIVAYVENPNTYMPYGVFGTPPPDAEGMSETTEGLFEYPSMWEDVTERRGDVPEQDVFEDAWAVADQYYACRTHGTQAHVWALLSPYQVQVEVLSQFPVYRDRAEIREYIETAKDVRFSDHEWTNVVDGSPDGRRVYPNPNVTDARVFSASNFTALADMNLVVYMGEEHRDENDEVVSLTAWDATALQGGQEQSNGTSLVLVHSESTGRWFVQGVNAPWG